MKFLFSIFFLLIFSLLNAQSFKAVYSVKRVVSKDRIDEMSEIAKKNFLEENARVKLYSLDYSEGISMYKNTAETKNTIYKQDVSPEYAVEENEKQVSVNQSFEKFFYKDFNQDVMLFKLNNAGINFDGKDKLIDWNWQITDETKEIKGFKCKKATSKAFGGNFVAWFTTEIAVKAGPEKFDGLPGLILNLQTAGEEYSVENVLVVTEKINIEKPILKSKTVTWQEMQVIAKNKFEGEKSFQGFGSKFSSY